MAAVASRYARAFADVVMSRKLDANKVIADLDALAKAVESSHELRNVLDSPTVPHEQKLKLLGALISQLNGDASLRNLAAIITEKHRLSSLSEIAALVKQELNERMNLADAEVVTARELGSDEKSALESQIARVTGKTVRATYTRDKGLLGGAVIKIGSTIYDGSVRGQLQHVREQLAQ